MIRSFLIPLAFLLTLTPAAAQDALPKRETIMAELATDFDSDGIEDRLIVTRNGDGGNFGDLQVFKGVGGTQFKRLSMTEEFGFGVYSIDQKRPGVFTVQSGTAQGRYKWEQTLTIAWRGGMLRVIGVTCASYDSLSEEKEGGRCDLNLATGKGTGQKGRAVRFTLKPVPVAEWTDERRPEVCDG